MTTLVRRPGSQLIDEDEVGHLWAQMGSGDGLVTTVGRLREPLAHLVHSCVSQAAFCDRGKQPETLDNGENLAAHVPR